MVLVVICITLVSWQCILGQGPFFSDPCSVNMRVLRCETAVLQYAESICHMILTFILDSQLENFKNILPNFTLVGHGY